MAWTTDEASSWSQSNCTGVSGGGLRQGQAGRGWHWISGGQMSSGDLGTRTRRDWISEGRMTRVLVQSRLGPSRTLSGLAARALFAKQPRRPGRNHLHNTGCRVACLRWLVPKKHSLTRPLEPCALIILRLFQADDMFFGCPESEPFKLCGLCINSGVETLPRRGAAHRSLAARCAVEQTEMV